ncbi:MAG: hypothetical protein RIS26_390 [Actinomycetota bacterium]
MSNDWGSDSWGGGSFQNEQPPAPKKKSKTGLIVGLSALGLFVLVAGGSILGGLAALNDQGSGNKPSTQNDKPEVSSQFNSNDLYSAPKDMEKFLDAVGSATVRVECTDSSGGGVSGTGWGISLTDSATTTADDSEPYEIITNWHVVDGCLDSKTVSIFLADSPNTPHVAHVFNYDNSYDSGSGNGDFAILTTATEVPTLATAKVAPKKAQWALAIGNPADADGNTLENHVSIGIISDYQADKQWVVTSAEVNPGNSGGPLINSRGEVVAVNTFVDIRENVSGLYYSLAVSQFCNHLITCKDSDSLNW